MRTVSSSKSWITFVYWHIARREKLKILVTAKAGPGDPGIHYNNRLIEGQSQVVRNR